MYQIFVLPKEQYGAPKTAEAATQRLNQQLQELSLLGTITQVVNQPYPNLWPATVHMQCHTLAYKLDFARSYEARTQDIKQRMTAMAATEPGIDEDVAFENAEFATDETWGQALDAALAKFPGHTKGRGVFEGEEPDTSGSYYQHLVYEMRCSSSEQPLTIAQVYEASPEARFPYTTPASN